MKNKKTNRVVSFLVSVFILASSISYSVNLTQLTHPVTANAIGTRVVTNQVLSQIEAWPRQPAPYADFDWKQRALDYDTFVYDWYATKQNPTILWDATHYNMSSTTYKVPAYYGDQRIFTDGTQEGVVQIPSAVMPVLLGVDKSHQQLDPTDASKGYMNYIPMLKTFIRDTPTGMMAYDSPGGTSYRDWWYDVTGSFAYTLLGSPDVTAKLSSPDTNTDTYILNMANNVYNQVVSLGGANADFKYQGFNDLTNSPVTGYDINFPANPDPLKNMRASWDCGETALQIGLMQYYAYKKFGDTKFLNAAKWTLDYFEKINDSYNPDYEWALYLGSYFAARMNAEQGTSYDTSRYIKWKIGQSSTNPNDYGVLQKSINGIDLYGLAGSTNMGRDGYGFALETFSAAFLAPAVKYDPSLAKTVGKYLLNVSNTSRMFYPDQMPANNQYYGSTYANAPEKVLPYEGIMGTGIDKDGITRAPIAAGDPESLDSQGVKVKIGWGMGESGTDLSVYGGAWAGLLGATIKNTNVSKILQIDVNALDFYKSENSYPTYLYYNPLETTQSVNITLSSPSDLYDAMTDTYLAYNVSGTTSFNIPADGTSLIVVAPANSSSTISYTANSTSINGIKVAYVPKTPTKSLPDRVNLALNKTVTSSSNNYSLSPSNAVDNRFTTTWISATSGTQWLKVDLGVAQNIDNVAIQWDNNYADNFSIDVSTDDVTYTTVHTNSSLPKLGTLQNYQRSNCQFPSVSARYIKVVCNSPGYMNNVWLDSTIRWYDYGIRELQVYGGNYSTNPNIIKNGDFEKDISGSQTISDWSTTNASVQYVVNDGSLSPKVLCHYSASPYSIYTYQDLTLPNGKYTISAMVNSSGGQNSAFISAEAYGGALKTANINSVGVGQWGMLQIQDINVTSGFVRICIVSDSANVGGSWIKADKIILSRDDNVNTSTSDVLRGFAIGKGSYVAGETVTITAIPTGNYSFTHWTVMSGGVTLANANASTTTFVMPTGDVEVKANFAIVVTGVSLDYATATIGRQVTKQLTETVSPTNADNKAVSWSSSNTAVATVSASGLITGIAAGTATITVTTADGGYTATCAVTVKRYDPTRYYKITYDSNSVLSMDSTTTGLNGVVKNVTYTGANSQQWQIIETTDASTFKIVNKATGYALKVNSTANSTNKQILQTTYVSANNMNFTISESTSYIQIVSKLGSNTYIKCTGATGGTLVTAAAATTTRWDITLLP